MADPHLLDTSAIFCLIDDEPGSDAVESVLQKEPVFASFISYLEFLYVRHQEEGEARAEEDYARLKALPIQVVESDGELRVMAARIKATQRLSLGDAWVAATAERLGAVLVHKDPEFDALSGRLRMLRLPSKRPR